MSSQPGATAQKPTLHGAKLKTRKRESKANAKFDAETFREQLLTVINEVDTSDFDAVSTKLDVAGNTLDYRRYGEAVFELLITGGLVVPGGIVEKDEDIETDFYVLNAPETLEGVKAYADMLNKLVRRYKYLLRPLEETTKNLLKNVNKFSSSEVNKLSILVALLSTYQLIPLSVLTALLSDHLVKDGISLVCLTTVLKTIIADQGITQLGRLLKKHQLEGRLIEFFPPNKQDEESFARHFEVEDMKPVVDLHNHIRANALRSELQDTIQDMIEKEATETEVALYIKRFAKEKQWSEGDIIGLVWDGIMGAVDWATRPEIIESQTLRQVKEWSRVLALFTTQPRTEVELLGHVQVYCYTNAKLMKHFASIVKILYDEDVLSENAIHFWNIKGVKPQGKAIFLKQMEPFVTALENASDDDEDDEE
ncbi:hypothetical protein IWQ60_003354 [Tieghemiomyces parasiticus]|uniref:W2 domain-containing protein n=1 Tax=Tieghemiomyces parasiticus TaxID=78921 RepID=A0A9W8AHL9_9FUNG|nr:hypothetical protein IWQ60_003354 [Tieghemiomyces parasiticus]